MSFNVICDRCTNKLCIEKVEMFNTLTHEDLLEIVKLTGHKKLLKGDYLCHEGDELSMMFIVNTGKIKLSKFNREGKEQIINILSDGDIFGEYHVFGIGEYNYSAIALTETKVCTISKDKMDFLLDKHPSITRKILNELSKKMISYENLVQNLSNINTDSKIAYVLKVLSEQYGVKENDGIRVEITLTKEELANYAGVTRETMSRKLSAFSKEGIIESQGYKTIIIRDLEKLLDKI